MAREAAGRDPHAQERRDEVTQAEAAGRHPAGEQVHEGLRRLYALYPEATTELEFADRFQLLIAVILSAQTTDKMVNQVSEDLFRHHPRPEAMLELTEEALAEKIRSIGLYRNKARFILGTCRLLVERHGGRVPDAYEDLIALPGVGRKTANVVLSTAFGQDRIAVDTHVFRVSHRLGWADGSTPLATERQLMDVLPRKDWSKAHHLLIWHGRRICSARQPDCESCPLTDLCRYYAARS